MDIGDSIRRTPLGDKGRIPRVLGRRRDRIDIRRGNPSDLAFRAGRGANAIAKRAEYPVVPQLAVVPQEYVPCFHVQLVLIRSGEVVEGLQA